MTWWELLILEQLVSLMKRCDRINYVFFKNNWNWFDESFKNYYHILNLFNWFEHFPNLNWIINSNNWIFINSSGYESWGSSSYCFGSNFQIIEFSVDSPCYIKMLLRHSDCCKSFCSFKKILETYDGFIRMK